jgi:uncharacterized protein (DUF58 family)
MIVPTTRLTLLAGLVLLPAGIAAAWRPDWGLPAAAAAGLLLLMTILDALFSRAKLKDILIEAPDVVRLTVNHAARIRVQLRKPAGMALRLRLALALPGAIDSDQQDLPCRLATDSAGVNLAWPCRALRRGRFALTRCHLETGSNLGLWAVRRSLALDSDIRVYPNLTSGQQHLRGLFRRREWGQRALRRIGKGREFEQLRDYLPGDSFEDIEWKATARRRCPITKVYQVEQSQEIYVVLDASRLSTRNAAYITDRRSQSRAPAAGTETTIFERYLTAALVMAVVAEQLNDRYGLLVFGDQPEGFIKAGRGRAHYNACRDALYSRMPRTVSPDFDELFAFVGTRVRKRALLVFLTSLDDPLLAESFIRAMRAATRQHILMVNMFRPPGAHPLFSSPQIRNIEGIYHHLVGHMQWASIDETQRRLKQHGAALHLLDKDRLCSQLVNQYMEVKQRQIL